MINQEEYLGLQEWTTNKESGYYLLEPLLFWLIIIVICIVIIALAYYYFKYTELSERWLLFRICIVLVIAIFILLVFALEYIKVYMSFGADNSNFIWTLLNATLIGIVIVVIGLGKSMSEIQKVLLLMIVVFLAIVGFGFIGVLIEFSEDFSFLGYKKFETNSVRGQYFLFTNFLFLLLVIGISFTTESEVRI